ncbi:MAG TPA: hypothetical protein V6D20_23900 [Candidatus Obscuribacterales bacterium]
MQDRDMTDEEALRDHLYGATGGKSECYCQDCGAYVCDAEPDAVWTGGGKSEQCPDCGPNTRIASVLIERGLI